MTWLNVVAPSVSDEDEARCSHLLFTLNVYQYRIEKANRAGLPGGEYSHYTSSLVLLRWQLLASSVCLSVCVSVCVFKGDGGVVGCC